MYATEETCDLQVNGILILSDSNSFVSTWTIVFHKRDEDEGAIVALHATDLIVSRPLVVTEYIFITVVLVKSAL